MSEFRNAIASTIYDTEAEHQFSNSVAMLTWMADAVLAMPEMQAIRRALQVWAEYAGTYDHTGPEYALRELLTDGEVVLPDSVIAWVLDEGSNP